MVLNVRIVITFGEWGRGVIRGEHKCFPHICPDSVPNNHQTWYFMWKLENKHIPCWNIQSIEYLSWIHDISWNNCIHICTDAAEARMDKPACNLIWIKPMALHYLVDIVWIFLSVKYLQKNKPVSHKNGLNKLQKVLLHFDPWGHILKFSWLSPGKSMSHVASYTSSFVS